MPAKQTAPQAKVPKRTAPNELKREVQSVLATLKRLGNPRFRAEMETRYGIVTPDAFGVRMNEMQRVAKQLGRNHSLALALWRPVTTRPARWRRSWPNRNASRLR
jgi:3-methyladenine DNA glycosylase AlkD